ncbi:MAG: recombinase family protein [Gammaproteobacteria bacterium]|nr:recombinase family protein [Gammaproteobacteria bacterium]
MLAGCGPIFTDEGVSGTATERAALDDLLGALRPADQVVVWTLDRLGRSLHHLIEVVAASVIFV